MLNDMQDISTSRLRFIGTRGEFSNGTDCEQCPSSPSYLINIRFALFYSYDTARDAGTGGAGGAAAPLAFCWEGQGGQKCPLSIKNII